MKKLMTFQLHQRRNRQRTEFTRREDLLDREDRSGTPIPGAGSGEGGGCPCGEGHLRKIGCDCLYDDTFTRVETVGWGDTAEGHHWDVTIENGSNDGLRVSGSQGVMFHRDLGDDQWTGTAVGLRSDNSPTNTPLEDPFVEPDNFEIYFEVTTPNPIQSLGLLIVHVNRPLAAPAPSRIQLDFSNNTILAARSYISAIPAAESNSAGFSFLSNTKYKVRTRLTSDRIFLKVWEDGDAEPDWELEVVPTSPRVPSTNQSPYCNFHWQSFDKIDTDPSEIAIDNVCIYNTQDDGSACYEATGATLSIHDQEGNEVDSGIDPDNPDIGDILSTKVITLLERVDGDTYSLPSGAVRVLSVTVDGLTIPGWTFTPPTTIELPHIVASSSEVRARYYME